jgi:Holliday junction resolvase RusA-like endonuclease
MYDPGTAEGWKALVAQAALRHLPSAPLDGPIRVDIVVSFRRPKSHYRTGKRADEIRPDAPIWHTAKPDRDNIEKAILDCLTTIGMWADDSQVCCGEVKKVWGRQGGAWIRIAQVGVEVPHHEL